MKKFSKVVSLLLCVCLIFSACSKNGDDDTTQPNGAGAITENPYKGDGKIALPYNKTDGLNPYFAKSYENLYVSQLLFEPLYAVDSKYNAVGVIAESISVNDNVATVRLKSGISCRGSSDINSEDVVYSFNMAKASHGWSTTLNGILSATAVSPTVVDFTLEYADVYVAGKLNFPIVKAATADIESAVPTGSGDYYFSTDRLVNIANGDKVIYLTSIGTNESSENAVNIGSTDVYFSDLSDCDYKAAAGKNSDILLNNMVYLGFNASNGALNSHVRNAIAAKIDSDHIALSSYQGHAVGGKLPVNPNSELISEITTIETKENMTLANDILDRCGYTRYSGKAKTNGAYTLALTLIVNRDNRFRVAAAYSIADSLEECGFYITVKTLSFEDYNERIKSGNYDMYLGEIKLDCTMDISEFFREGSSLSAGINKQERVVTEFYKYRAGEISAKEYYDVFVEYYPIVPVVFRNGYVVTSGDVTLGLNQMPYSLYNGI